VNRWLLRAPAWALALVSAVPIALLFTLMERFARGESWPVAVVGGLLTGAICGAFLGWILRRRLERLLDSVGEASDEVRVRVASRGTLLGPPPEDPEARAATARLIDSQLAQVRRRRWSGPALHLVFIGLLAWQAVVSSPWWWLGVAFFAGSLVLLLRIPRLLERRAELLRRGA
jgi:hypothetical protein